MGSAEHLAAGKRNPANAEKKGGVNMKSRYCYCPMTAKKIGRRVTLFDRIRRRKALKRNIFDVFPTCGYNSPVYPGK